MGNTASHSSTPDSRRLSKHETSSPGYVIVEEPAHLAATSKPFRSRLSVKEHNPLSPYWDYANPREVRQQVHSEIFCSSEQDGNGDSRSRGTRVAGNKEEEDGLAEMASYVRDKLSRSASVVSRMPSTNTSSIKLSSANASHLSFTSEPRSIDLKSTIAILRELKKSASPEDLAALREALMPDNTTSRTPAGNTTLEDASNPLIRRSSLAVPGLATRFADADISTNSPTRTDGPVNSEMYDNSPLARLAALGASRYDPDLCTPRAETPSDLTYSHLGGLKLGSLVVTNGAASPVPSVCAPLNQPLTSSLSQVQDDGYFSSTSEDRCSNPRNLVVPSKSQLQVPLRHQASTASVMTASSWASRTTIREGPSRTDTDERETVRRDYAGNGLRKSAPSLAQGYMSELPDSPYSITSEMCFRTEALRLLDGTLKPNVVDLNLDLDHLVSAADVDALKACKSAEVTKADSGYSSSSSVQDEPVEGSLNGNTRFSSTRPVPTRSVTDLPAKSTPVSRFSRFSLKSSTSMSLMRNPASKSIGSCDQTAPPSGTTAMRKQNKLQRNRRPQPVSISVQCVRPIDEGSIPSIPETVAAGLIQRLSSQPEMEFLDRTYASVDDVEPENNAEQWVPLQLQIRFPSASPSPEPSPSATSRWSRTRSQPPRPLPRLSTASSERLSEHTGKARYRPHSKESDVDIPAISDLGSVAHCIGSSPYDVAMSPVVAKPVTSRTLPHQLSIRIPSAEFSPVGMDEATAANYARQKSNHRSQAAYLEQTSRPQVNQPNSYQIEGGFLAGEIYSERPLNQRANTLMGLDRPLPPLPGNESGYRRRATTAAESTALYQTCKPVDWREQSELWRQRKISMGEVDHRGGLRRVY